MNQTKQYPFLYSPLYNCKKSDKGDQFNKQKKSRYNPSNNEEDLNSLAKFIKGPPTYVFDIKDVKKSKSELLHENLINDPKILCTTDLLLYPELAISNGLFASQNVSKFSQFDIIPSCEENDRIHCFCHKKSSKLPMAMCSVCNCWSHLLCYNISEDKIPEIFICIYCQHNLVAGIMKQIKKILAPLKSAFQKHYNDLVPIEKQAINCSKDLMIQINGIFQMTQIQAKMFNFVESSHKLWNDIIDARNQIETILTSFVWEKAPEDMETYDEESDPQINNNNNEKEDLG